MARLASWTGKDEPVQYEKPELLATQFRRAEIKSLCCYSPERVRGALSELGKLKPPLTKTLGTKKNNGNNDCDIHHITGEGVAWIKRHCED